MAVILTLVIFYAPVIIFNAIVLLIIMGGLYEFFKLALPNDPIYRETGWIFGIAISAAILFFSLLFIGPGKISLDNKLAQLKKDAYTERHK